MCVLWIKSTANIVLSTSPLSTALQAINTFNPGVAKLCFSVGKDNFSLCRICGKCKKAFGTERGLKSHITWSEKRGKSCGTKTKREKKKLAKARNAERNETLNNQKFKSVAPTLDETMAVRATRPQGKPIKKDEKLAILRVFDSARADLDDLKDKESKVSILTK